MNPPSSHRPCVPFGARRFCGSQGCCIRSTPALLNVSALPLTSCPSAGRQPRLSNCYHCSALSALLFSSTACPSLLWFSPVSSVRWSGLISGWGVLQKSCCSVTTATALFQHREYCVTRKQPPGHQIASSQHRRFCKWDAQSSQSLLSQSTASGSPAAC